MASGLSIEADTTSRTRAALGAYALGAMLSVMALAWFSAALAPIGFSIAIVFLFAGPHNWFEARYMLKRMPARWGPLWPYFTLGLAGTAALAAALIGVSLLARSEVASSGSVYLLLALWNGTFLGWIVLLAWQRSRQNPRRDWPWLWPLGLMAIALACQWPVLFGVGLVYAHPLMSLWFLDRELSRARSPWLKAYRVCLGCLPLALFALWTTLYQSPHLPGDDALADAIAGHAGGGVLGGISTHLLVSTHTFLEMLHYAVWILALPLLSIRRWPWQIDDVPLARRSALWRKGVLGVVLLGAGVMVLLWLSFLANYPVTREIYFLVATVHVLAEVPFLLRLL